MDNKFTLNELVDLIQQDLTVNCALPKVVPDEAIQRIITQKGLRWFYRWYMNATQRTYYYVDLIQMYRNRSTDSKFFYLPDEIESIKWIYLVNYNEMRNLGYILPTNAIGFGATSQSYVASINVSEWAEALTTMNNFNDALSSYSKNTVKFHFDSNTKRFEVLTYLDKNLILEVYAHIPPEALFGDPIFIKWVTGNAYIEMARVLGFDDMPMAGDVKVNYEKYYELGDAMKKEAEETVLKMSRSTRAFINRTR